MGRLDAIKNVLVLARAVRQLLDAGVDLHLICAGQGPDRDAVTALLGDRVTCPGVLAPATLQPIAGQHPFSPALLVPGTSAGVSFRFATSSMTS